MAEAFFNQMAKGRAKGISAGTIPSKSVNTAVVAAMRRAGLDISHNKPKSLTPEMIQTADRIINMGCLDSAACPAGFVVAEDWGLADPHDKPFEEVVKIRDEIKQRVEALVNSMGL